MCVHYLIREYIRETLYAWMEMDIKWLHILCDSVLLVRRLPLEASGPQAQVPAAEIRSPRLSSPERIMAP